MQGFGGGSMLKSGRDASPDVMVIGGGGGGGGPVPSNSGRGEGGGGMSLNPAQVGPQKGGRMGSRKVRDGKILASEGSVSEHTGDLLDSHKRKDDNLEVMNMEGSTNSNSGGKKRGSGGREGKAPSKRARPGGQASGTVGSTGRMPRTNPNGGEIGLGGSDGNHSTAFIAAAHAAAQVAAEAGEPIPNDAKPTRITKSGLYYLQENQYRLWPGGDVVSTLPSEIEATQSLLRRVPGRVSWYESAAGNQTGRKAPDHPPSTRKQKRGPGTFYLLYGEQYDF